MEMVLFKSIIHSLVAHDKMLLLLTFVFYTIFFINHEYIYGRCHLPRSAFMVFEKVIHLI